MKNLSKLKNKKVTDGFIKQATFFMIIVFGSLVYSCTQKADLVSSKQTPNYIVTQDQALSAAKNFNFPANTQKGNLKSSVKTRKVKSVEEIKDQDGEPLFYVTNYDSTGFVIVSGDNRIKPILAFSENHSFKIDQEVLSHTGLGYWIDATENGIRKIRTQNLKQNTTVKELWDRQLGLKNAPIDPPCTGFYYTKGPLTQTTWGQGCGYNALLPFCSSGDCGHVATGCVATAMAQVMKYHNYPGSYDWLAMPNPYGSSETARLMKDIGSAVVMNFGCTESGAYTSSIAPALIHAFGYSSSAQLINYANTGNYNTVENNINNNEPVIFSGGGHAWMCDGYIDQFFCLSGGTGVEYLLFYMNWGWDGSEDGWFAFNDFNPTNGGQVQDFYTDSQVVVNIHP